MVAGERLNGAIEQIARSNLVEHRPWGSFEILEQGANFKVKILRVNPQAKLSLQKHEHRTEHWTVVRGKAFVTVGKEQSELMVDESIYVPQGETHRIENQQDDELEIIEVQTGNYLEEDDITRLDDIYGRVSERRPVRNS